jgi:hypothetical protein
MSVEHTILEPSFSTCGNGNTKMHSMCTVEFIWHCQQYYSTESCTKILLLRIHFAVNHQGGLGFHVKCPMFLSDFNILRVSQDLNESCQYYFSQKTVP